MSVDTCIEVARGRTSINVSRKRDDKPHWSTYRGENGMVRVFRIQPDRVELQIRSGDHYANASLQKNEVKAAIGELTKALEELR